MVSGGSRSPRSMGWFDRRGRNGSIFFGTHTYFVVHAYYYLHVLGGICSRRPFVVFVRVTLLLLLPVLVLSIVLSCVALFGVLMLLDYAWSPTGRRTLINSSTAHRLKPRNTRNTINRNTMTAILSMQNLCFDVICHDSSL